MKAPVVLAGREVRVGRPCYVIAEAGVNHNGQVELAHDLIDVAARGGADAVKFQTFHPGDLASETARAAPYQAATTSHATQRRMLESLTLPRSAWPELRDHAHEQGLHFLSTPFDMGSAELLADLGVPALKVPSGELTNTPFIRSLAGLGLPLLLSTGMGDHDEVATAVDACRTAPSLALFHCVSAYPTHESDANLRAIATMRDAFGVPTGWSDHTTGSFTAICAVALGACLVEKHVTLSRAMEGPDHAASEEPEGFEAYVHAIRRAETVLGDGVKQPRAPELENREVARRSWHATRDLHAGTIISDGDLVALRPAIGVPPSTPLAGLRLRTTVSAGQPVHHADVAAHPSDAAP